jgi:prolyl-tRNA synthetase
MGGSASEEFLAESEIGEDTFVRCLESGYAANVEAVTTAGPDALPLEGLHEPQVHDTGDTPTIASLEDPFSTPFPQPAFLTGAELLSLPASGPPVPPPRC